jgi:hypothetical protein
MSGLPIILLDKTTALEVTNYKRKYTICGNERDAEGFWAMNGVASTNRLQIGALK